MTNYNSTLQSNNTDLQEVLQILQNKASSSGFVLQDKTITPTKDTQIIIADNGYDGLNEVTVNAIPSTYVQPSSTKGTTTYTPTTTNQTIAAGTYLTGVQTIKGDANLVSQNIKSGVSIFGVEGTLEAGSGGNEPVGVCPSLTITLEEAFLESVAFVNDGIYKSGSLLDSTSAICQNADIGQPVIINAYGDLVGNIAPKNYTNLEILYSDGNTIIAKCTSTNPATLTIYDFDPNTGG